jgi:hypothetical protein
MVWPFQNKPLASYWLKVFAWYALTEACIQLLFLYIINNYGTRPISNWEFHFIMWVFQCLLIWPIWWVAWRVSRYSILVQIITAIGFYFLYSYIWFGVVQDAIAFLHSQLQQVTRTEKDRIASAVDQSGNYSYINYQLLKHGFRLSWFFLANYFYHYRLEEEKRLELAVSNKELQLKLLKWHLNPQFYFKTINQLSAIAADSPVHCTGPILQLAKVMEYVIYEAKEKLIDVKKEIHFLRNYIELVSKQPGNRPVFELTTRGEYDKLKIAPLLLAGIIDKIAAESNMNGSKQYLLCLGFNASEMEFSVKGDFGNKPGDLFSSQDPLIIRLRELYPEKFSFHFLSGNNQLNLRVRLDEQG